MKKLTIIILSLLPALAAAARDGDALDIYINFQGAFQSALAQGSGFNGKFAAKDLRLEFRGNVTDELYYRYRQKLFRPNSQGSFDAFGKNVDFMMAGYRFAPGWGIEAGKMCQHWGGFEYDETPMYIYEYSDMLNNMEIFFAGVALAWEPLPGQELVLEVSNSLNDSFEETYGLPAGMAAKVPFSYMLNWNGTLLGGRVLTRWAAGMIHETCLGDNAYLLTLGQKLVLPRLQWYFDYMFEFDNVDRLAYASADFGRGTLENLAYQALVTKANWRFMPSWNLMLKASVSDSQSRLHFGYGCALEYYPVKGQDLRFFLAFLGGKYKFKAASLPDPYRTDRLEIGIMYNLKCI